MNVEKISCLLCKGLYCLSTDNVKPRDQRNPKLLKCGHSFCNQCLEIKCTKDYGTLTCPSCGKTTLGEAQSCLAAINLILFARTNEGFASTVLTKVAKTKATVSKELSVMKVLLEDRTLDRESLLSSLKLRKETVKNMINEKADQMVALIRSKQNAAITEIDCKTFGYLDGLEEHVKALNSIILEQTEMSQHIVKNDVDEYEVCKLAEALTLRQRAVIEAAENISSSAPFTETLDRFESSLSAAEVIGELQRLVTSFFSGEAASVPKVHVGPKVQSQPLSRQAGIIGRGRGSGPGQLGYPNGLALSCGHSDEGEAPQQLFVADWGSNHRIQVFNAVTGEYMRTIGGGNGSMPGKLSGPADIALYKPANGADTLLFVADCGNHRIQVFDANTGNFVRTIGEGRGAGPGQLSGPSGIVLKITAIPKTLGDGEQEPSEDVRLYVADHGNSRVVCFSALTGRYLRLIGAGKGSGPGQLSGPFGLALQYPKGGRRGDPVQLFVADYGNNRVQVFDSLTGRFLRSVGTGAAQLNHPRGLALSDSEDGPQLYVADCGNHRVMVYDAKSGRLLRTIGNGEGSEQGQISCPNGILVHPCVGGTLVFVAEIGNNRIQVLVT